MKIKRSFYFILLILLISGIFAFLTQEIYLFRILYLYTFLLITSFFWSFFSIRGLSLRRVSRISRIQAGTLFEESYEIINQSRFPKLWLKITDLSTLDPDHHFGEVITNMGGRQERRLINKLLIRHRGECDLGPTQINSGDPFGIFENIAIFPPEKSILVFPFALDIRKIIFPQGILSGGVSRRKSSQDISPYAAGVRDYSIGDSYNRIDWKTTAHRDRLMTKEFDLDPQTPIWVFLDCEKTVQINNSNLSHLDFDIQDRVVENEALLLPNDTFEYSVSACLAVCHSFLDQGNAVGLVNSELALSILPPEKGERQENKILERLTFVKCNGRESVAGIVLSQSSGMSKGNMVIIITASGNTELVELSEVLSRRGIKPVYLLVSREDFGSSGSSDLLQSLESRNIPVAIIRKGQSLIM